MSNDITFINEPWDCAPNHLQPGSVDLFFCDPPYFLANKRKKDINLIDGNVNDWDSQWENPDEYLRWTEKWLKLAYDLLKETGSIYVCISWQYSGDYQKLLEKVGFTIQNRLTWKRDKGRGSIKNWKSMHEDIWFATKSKASYTFNIDDVKVKKDVVAPYRDENGDPKDWYVDSTGKKVRMTYPGNMWCDFVVPFWSMAEVKSYAKSKKSPKNTLEKHNTQKPKELVKRCIVASSNKDDLVVDFFLGSGTTGIAARDTGRKFVGFDINILCIEMATTRLKNE